MHFSEPTFWICWTPFNQTHYVYNLFNVVLCAKMKFETYKIVYSNPFWISLQNKNIFTIPICRKWLSRLYTSLITSEEKKFLLRLPINLALLISDSLLNLFTIFLTYKNIQNKSICLSSREKYCRTEIKRFENTQM